MRSKRGRFWTPKRAGGGGDATRGRGSRGATLVEIVSTLAILALLAGAAVPSFRRSLDGVELRRAAVQLAAALERGRAAAMTQGRSWRLAVATDSYTLGPVGGGGLREVLPGGAVFTGSTSGGAVRFSPSGTAENATFTLGLGGATRRVIVNQRGKVLCE